MHAIKRMRIVKLVSITISWKRRRKACVTIAMELVSARAYCFTAIPALYHAYFRMEIGGMTVGCIHTTVNMVEK
jgi:hypothetical protein